MALLLEPTKIEFDKNCLNNFNIQSLTHPEAVHIKTDTQVAYHIHLGHPWIPWKGKEMTSPIELVPCPNSSGISGDHQNNWTSNIYLSIAPPFLAFGPCVVSNPFGLRPGGNAHP
jgi:hypothetical protein